MQRGNLTIGGNIDNINNMDNMVSTNALAASRNSLTLARLQSQHQQRQQQQQSAVASFLAGSRQGPPNVPSLLFQQQNQQLVPHGLLTGGGAGTSPGAGTDLTSVALRRQEEHLLATQFLLQQQQLDEFLSSSTGSANAAGPGLAQQLLGTSVPNRAGFEQSDAALLASQRMLSKALSTPDSTNLVKPIPGTGPSKFDSTQKPDEPNHEPSKAVDTSLDAEQTDAATNADDSDNDKDDDSKNPSVAGATENFPLKLYRMIEEAEKEKNDDIVSFLPHGRAFAIHKPRQFISDIMPKYFTTSRMSSFQRQLNLYGFRRITEGRDKGGYFHDFFLKGRKKLCKKIKRKKTSVKAAPNLFGGVGLPQMAANLHSFNSQDLLMRQALTGGIDSGLTRAAVGQGLMGNNLLPGASGWSGINPGTTANQEASLAALVEQQQQQQQQQIVANRIRLQQLQQTQLLDQLERQEQLRRTSGI